MYIGIDFDGTCTTHAYPEIGRDIGAVPVLKKLVENGHQLILYTMRSDMNDRQYLKEAVQWFADNDIELYAIQKNPTQHHWTTSNKCYANLYIDDAALGIPLIHDKDNRPFVDWQEVEKLLITIGVLRNGK